MKIIEQTWEWEQCPIKALERIERAGRTCYKSEDRITPDSAKKFVKMILSRGHETVLEHVSATVRFITNRGVTHELVRHRLASFSQESTRYVRYSDEILFIKPVWWDDESYSEASKEIWLDHMQNAEADYLKLLETGDKPEQAREVLPHALKTEIVMTADLREWRHVFKLRCAHDAHPQIRTLMRSCLAGFVETVPIIFDDLAEEFLK